MGVLSESFDDWGQPIEEAPEDQTDLLKREAERLSKEIETLQSQLGKHDRESKEWETIDMRLSNRSRRLKDIRSQLARRGVTQ